MKKYIALMLAAMLCFSLAGCGGSEAETEQNSTPVVSTTLRRSMYDEVNGCYTNSYTQLTVTVPGDWYLYRDSDLAAAYLNGSVTGDELAMWGAADFKNRMLIPDFAAQDMANSNNLSVVYVNLDNVEDGAYAEEHDFHYLVIQHMSQQDRVLSQTDDEIISICDKDFYLFRFKDADTHWYMAMKKQDNYMIVITATDRTGVGKELFFGCFE